MHRRASRLAVAALLVAAGITGGFFVLAAHRTSAAVLAANDDVSGRLDRMIAAAGDIASAQHAYVAPGQPDQPWRDRSAALLGQFTEDAAMVRPRLRSPAAGRAVESIARDLRTLIAIDGNARQDLQDAQSLLAADLIFSEGRDTVSALVSTIRAVRNAEQQTAMAEYAFLERRQAMMLGSVAAIWLVGLMALIPRPARNAAAVATPVKITPSSRHLDDAGANRTAAIDLAGVAEICATLARLSDAAALPAVLERAAAVLDARGLIIWMVVGDQLFPALAHGYDQPFISRLKPIPRLAENATADACRSGEQRTVAAGPASHGAVVTPLAGMSGCVGVFAAEVRHGREHDRSTQAVAVMIAAQLASVLSPSSAGTSVPAAGRAESGLITASGGQ